MPGSMAVGGQQALNSYRNAGAALLHAMQHGDTGLPSSGRTGTSCGSSMAGCGGPAPAGPPAGGTMILSTSPSRPAYGSDSAEIDGQCPALPPWGPSPGLPWADASTASLLKVAPPSVDGACSLSAFAGAGAPVAAGALVAALGLLAAQDLPSDEQLPSSARDVSGVPMLSKRSVRNTFIDYKLARSPSVERFFEERKVRSSPTSRQLSRQGSSSSLRFALDIDDPFAIATPTDSVFPTPKHRYAPRDPLMGLSPGCLQDLQGMPTPEPDMGGALPVLRLSQFISDGLPSERPADTVASAAARLAAELRQGSSLMPRTMGKVTGGSAVCSTAATSAPGSALVVGSMVPSTSASTSGGSGLIPGSAQVPQDMHMRMGMGISRGSALHAVGACKPCAFVFQDGCANGVDCEFCHLCDPGERKRRKKERRKLAAHWKGRFGQEC